jgi:hypothetical protein
MICEDELIRNYNELKKAEKGQYHRNLSGIIGQVSIQFMKRKRNAEYIIHSI